MSADGIRKIFDAGHFSLPGNQPIGDETVSAVRSEALADGVVDVREAVQIATAIRWTKTVSGAQADTLEPGAEKKLVDLARNDLSSVAHFDALSAADRAYFTFNVYDGDLGFRSERFDLGEADRERSNELASGGIDAVYELQESTGTNLTRDGQDYGSLLWASYKLQDGDDVDAAPSREVTIYSDSNGTEYHHTVEDLVWD